MVVTGSAVWVVCACLPAYLSGLLEPGTWGEGGETDRGRQAAAAASARRRLSSTSSTSSASTAHHSGSMRLSVTGGLPGGERECCCGARGEGREGVPLIVAAAGRQGA